MKKTVLSLVIASVVSFSLHAAVIEGSYDGKGKYPDEKQPYTTMVTITKNGNDIYEAHWTEYHWTNDATPTKYTSMYNGTGLMKNDQLSFVYECTTDKECNDTGLQMYTVKEGQLEGNFVSFGGKVVGTETLIKKK